MKCANLPCGKEFEPKRKGQKFCCKQCAVNSNNRKLRNADKKKTNEANAKWRAEHPEQNRLIHGRAVAKSYREGKLPKWMTEK